MHSHVKSLLEFRPIDSDEMWKILHGVMGVDGVSAKMLKMAFPYYESTIVDILNLSLSFGKMLSN